MLSHFIEGEVLIVVVFWRLKAHGFCAYLVLDERNKKHTSELSLILPPHCSSCAGGCSVPSTMKGCHCPQKPLQNHSALLQTQRWCQTDGSRPGSAPTTQIPTAASTANTSVPNAERIFQRHAWQAKDNALQSQNVIRHPPASPKHNQPVSCKNCAKKGKAGRRFSMKHSSSVCCI